MWQKENWANEVESLCKQYNIIGSKQITDMSPQAFKRYINRKIEASAFEKLHDDCQSKKKTEGVTYRNLKLQSYLYQMDPSKPELFSGSDRVC